MTYAYSFNIHDVERAINVGQSRFLKYGEGDSFISNTTERAVGVYDGTFTHWDGNLEISGLSNRALDVDRSTLDLINLTIIGNPDNGERAADIRASKFPVVNLQISNSGRDGMEIGGSEGGIENLQITNSIEAWPKSICQ